MGRNTKKGSTRDSATVRKMAGEWLESISAKVKESTLARYRLAVENHITPKFGDTPVLEITRKTVESFARELIERGGKKGGALSSKTASDILSVLKALLEFAARRLGAPSPDMSGISLPKREQAVRLMKGNDMKKLVMFLLDGMNLMKLGILLCAFTGMRIGELCALKWGDIDLRRKTVKISKTLQRIQCQGDEGGKKTKIIETPPKSLSSWREVPLPKELMPLIKELAGENDAYVLSGKADKPVEPRLVQIRFKAYLRELGIDSINFHALRHHFATACVATGCEVKCLSEMLGHSNVQMTLDKYVHPAMELKRAGMEKAVAFLGGWAVGATPSAPRAGVATVFVKGRASRKTAPRTAETRGGQNYGEHGKADCKQTKAKKKRKVQKNNIYGGMRRFSDNVHVPGRGGQSYL